jgi:capsule polysaccharide export protein KpsE/RkpR
MNETLVRKLAAEIVRLAAERDTAAAALEAKDAQIEALRARAESAEAERDRLRDALIACRDSVQLDVAQMTRKALCDGGWSSKDLESAKRKNAILDTIDAAAKGRG